MCPWRPKQASKADLLLLGKLRLGAAPLCSERCLLFWDERPLMIQASVSEDPGPWGSVGQDNCNVSPSAVATDQPTLLKPVNWNWLIPAFAASSLGFVPFVLTGCYGW